MGSNKDWITDGKYLWDDMDDSWPTYTATHSEIYTATNTETATVGPFESLFDSNTPDMFKVHELMELKKKYPALQQAWDHYQIVLKMCRAKESENEN